MNDNNNYYDKNNYCGQEGIERRAMLDEQTRKEIDDIQITVHKLDKMKQDRVPTTVVIGFVTWLLGVSWYGGTQLAAIKAEQATLTSMIKLLAEDRYYGRDARRDLALLNQRDSELENKINQNKKDIDAIEVQIRELNRRK